MGNWKEVRCVCGRLPAGPRIVVVGSTSFHDSESERTCIEIGSQLGEVSDLILITGGVPGVGDTVGRSSTALACAETERTRLFHLLPEGSRPRPYGETLFAGSEMANGADLARIAGLSRRRRWAGHSSRTGCCRALKELPWFRLAALADTPACCMRKRHDHIGLTKSHGNHWGEATFIREMSLRR